MLISTCLVLAAAVALLRNPRYRYSLPMYADWALTGVLNPVLDDFCIDNGCALQHNYTLITTIFYSIYFNIRAFVTYTGAQFMYYNYPSQKNLKDKLMSI